MRCAYWVCISVCVCVSSRKYVYTAVKLIRKTDVKRGAGAFKRDGRCHRHASDFHIFGGSQLWAESRPMALNLKSLDNLIIAIMHINWKT